MFKTNFQNLIVCVMRSHLKQVRTNKRKLYAERAMIDYIEREFTTTDLVIVSPDAGGAKRYSVLTLSILSFNRPTL